jgi:site-specific recombinase XerD
VRGGRVRLNVDMRVVQRILTHDQVGTTRIYTEPTR